VDAFQQFSQKKGVEPYTTKISNKSADFERIPLWACRFVMKKIFTKF